MTKSHLHRRRAARRTGYDEGLAVGEAERNNLKGKYQSIVVLLNAARNRIQEIFDHLDDEGDRVYLGSTNHRDWLRDMLDHMDRWSFDAILPKGDINKMEGDPYAEIRKPRDRAEAAEAELEGLQKWRPISEADNGIAYVHIVGDMRIGNSYPIWARDADGRVYEALWSDNGKQAYWWDIEGESPVDPVEFMPHPLDQRFTESADVSPDATKAESEEAACPICLEPLKPEDICATDIELGICHAGCLAGASVVDLNTGEPREGPIDTYRYDSLDEVKP